MKEKLANIWRSTATGNIGVMVNAGAGILNLTLLAILPSGPLDGLLWFSAGIALSTAAWLYLAVFNRKGYEEIYEIQRKFIDDLIEGAKYLQSHQVSAQEVRSSVAKFLDDQDDKPEVRHNRPKVH